MQKKGITADKQITRTIEETAADPKLRTRVASLAPYLAEIEVTRLEIQRRKKLRSLAKKSKKNLNQSSARSFRIKQKSVTSLQREGMLKTRQIDTSNLVCRLLQERANRQQRRAKSVQRAQQFQFSKTIQSRTEQSKNNNNAFFNELYVRVKSKVQKQHPLRKKQYETLEGQRARSEQAGEINLNKIASTNVDKMPVRQDTQQLGKTIGDYKRKEQKKGNFRRNKYELNSSLAEPTETITQELKKEQIQSDSHLELDKKESNVSINREMDRLAERQMQNYAQIRNKEINRSVQRSTEKYFNYESYRPAKSKNDIQVLVSTAKYPSLHKASHSTTDRHPPNATQPIAAHIYDFDFQNQNEAASQPYQHIEQITPSQQQSILVRVQVGSGTGQVKCQQGMSWSQVECINQV